MHVALPLVLYKSGILNNILTMTCYEKAFLALLFHDLEYKPYLCVHDTRQSPVSQRMSFYGLNLWLVTPTILSCFSILVLYWRRSGGHYTIISNSWVSAKATCGERGSNQLHTCVQSWIESRCEKKTPHFIKIHYLLDAQNPECYINVVLLNYSSTTVYMGTVLVILY